MGEHLTVDAPSEPLCVQQCGSYCTKESGRYPTGLAPGTEVPANKTVRLELHDLPLEIAGTTVDLAHLMLPFRLAELTMCSSDTDPLCSRQDIQRRSITGHVARCSAIPGTHVSTAHCHTAQLG